MNDRILFDASTSVGFKYGFVPFVLTGIVIGILVICYVFCNDVYTLTPVKVLSFLVVTVIMEIVLFKLLEITNRVMLFSRDDKLFVNIILKKSNKIEEEVVAFEYWWSYDNRGGETETEEWGAAFFDDGTSDLKNGTVRERTLTLTRVLFLELKTSRNTVILVTEYLDNLKELPRDWPYKLRPHYKKIEIESCKLNELKSRLKNE